MIISNYDINIHSDSEYAFRWSCCNCHIQIVELLINLYPNINVHVKSEYTFRYCCRNGHFELAKLLLKINSNIYINAKNKYALQYSKVKRNIIME